jgi:hypothetical protein
MDGLRQGSDLLQCPSPSFAASRCARSASAMPRARSPAMQKYSRHRLVSAQQRVSGCGHAAAHASASSSAASTSSAGLLWQASAAGQRASATTSVCTPLTRP